MAARYRRSAATGPGFTTALRVTVAGSSANIWDAAIGWNTIAAANAGDRIQTTFWVRKVSPLDGNNIRAALVFQQAASPYTSSLRTPFPCDSNVWTKYVITARAAINYPSGGGSLTIQCAYGPQTFEIGGVSCVNLGPPPALPGSVAVIPADLSGVYNYGTGTTVTPITVSGQPFTSGYHVTTTSDLDNVYSAGLGWNNSAALNANDTCLITFWARKVSPPDSSPVKAQVVFETNGGNYDKSLGATFPVDTDTWQQYSIPFKVVQNYAVGGAHLVFQYGYGPQEFEIGGLSVKNYGQNITPDRFATSFYYNGRDQNAAWRSAANTRIDSLRKGDLTVTVRDTNGNPIPGATVIVNQAGTRLSHFGSAVTGQHIVGKDGTAQDNDIYRSRITSHFTTSVMENDLKWPGWESWFPKADTVSAIAWLRSNGLTVRGHNLIWPAFGNMPSDTASLSATDLRTRINNHFTDILTYAGINGQLYQWDVINEPFANYDVQGRISGVTGVTPSSGILGNAEMVSWFQQARQRDPNAKLFLNDYDILAGGGVNKVHQDYYYALAQYLLSNGAPLDGMGMQGHFGGPTPIPLMQTIIDRFSGLPVRLAITEYDFNNLDEGLQADFTRDLMTLIFSSERFDDFVMWGFWENSHWLPLGAMYRGDWSSRPMALVYNDLLFNQWFTNATATTGANGTATVRGFKGPYTVQATYNGVTGTATTYLSTTGAVTITLNTNAPGTVPVYRINSGGAAASPFTADQYASGGSTFSNSNAITTTGVTNPAPVAVYRSERYGNHTYTLPGLTAGATYKVRLHFAEIYWTASGKRKFNVSINATQVLANFDIFAAAGGANKAIVREFNATANASGQIIIAYTTVTDNAKSSGIEILR